MGGGQEVSDLGDSADPGRFHHKKAAFTDILACCFEEYAEKEKLSVGGFGMGSYFIELFPGFFFRLRGFKE
ncbi:MAG TPA: hypothetical protein ENN69_00055 [Spirochaetia bacterium]|nr:hypothetical protein [Spirochaetia bacterium]